MTTGPEVLWEVRWLKSVMQFAHWKFFPETGSQSSQVRWQKHHKENWWCPCHCPSSQVFYLTAKPTAKNCQVVHPSCPLRAEPHFDSKAGLSVTPFRWGKKAKMSTEVLGWKQRGREMFGPKWTGSENLAKITVQGDNHAKKSFLKPGTRRKWQEILKKNASETYLYNN